MLNKFRHLLIFFFFDPRKDCIPQLNARQQDSVHTKHSPRKDRPQKIERHSRQGDVTDLDILVAPLVEELDLALVGEDILGKGGEGRNLDVPVVGHVDCVEGEWMGTGFGDVRLNDRSVERSTSEIGGALA